MDIFVIRSISFCDVTKSKLYTFHPGFVGDPEGPSINKKNYDFIWNQKFIKKNYNVAFKNMIVSLKEIVTYAKKKGVRIAIETEGSFKKKNFALMQKPAEFAKLFKYFSPQDLGINLNIGHLNLASRAFNFSREKFVSKIKPYVVALELSHNNRANDQHLPLKKKAWYWKIINDHDFINIYKILEFRNTEIRKVKKIIKFF